MLKRIVIIAMLSVLAAVGSAATFTVTTTVWDYGTTGSLAWALDMNTHTPGPNIINFQIPSTGPQTIFCSSFYISNPVTIDGSSQDPFSSTPPIILAFSTMSNLSLDADNCTLSNMAILGTKAHDLITVSGDHCTVESCVIGARADAVQLPGATGILVNNLNNAVVGTNIFNCTLGSQSTGIQLIDNTNTYIQGCAIGTDKNELVSNPCLGNGIQVIGCTGTVIGPLASNPGNIIAHCGADGIALIDSPDSVMIGNRIYDCGLMAIDHGMDGQSSNWYQNENIPTGGTQNCPYLDSVFSHNNIITVNGNFNSEPNKQYILEFYASDRPKVPFSGESKYILGSKQVTTDNIGNVIFTGTFPDVLPPGSDYVFSGSATRADKTWGTSEIGGFISTSFQSIMDEKDPAADSGWVHSGIDSGPEYAADPTTPDDVDVDSQPGVLQIIVRPSTARSRIAGWTSPAIVTSTNPEGTYYRGKFYIYTSNAADAPINTIPNFRLRLDNEGAMLASSSYNFAMTGISAPPQESFYGLLNNPDVESREAASLRPSSNPLKPSLYRVDFLPIPVPAQIGSNVGATFESYSTEDPANGTLSLTEFEIATYLPNPSDPSSSITLIYIPDGTLKATVSVPNSTFVTTSSGKFNAENDFRAGRRQALDLPGEVSDSQLSQITELPDDGGILLDSQNVPNDKFGIGLFNLGSNNNALTPRIKPDTLYLGIFIVVSDLPAEDPSPSTRVQGGIQFQLQTAGGAITNRMELSGPANFYTPGSTARKILDQVLPSSQCINPLAISGSNGPNERGGEYAVIMSTPLDPDIRRDNGGALGPLATEPGPGVNAPSIRDITAGITFLQQPTTLRVSDNLVIPWAPPNRVKVRVLAVLLQEVTQIYDGGYAY